MKRNLLPPFVAIAMTKSQFCFSTGLTPYNLRKILTQKADKYERLGYHKYDKLLLPAVVRELLAELGLQIDMDYYASYVAAQRSIYQQAQ